jgi:hypothetical protein
VREWLTLTVADSAQHTQQSPLRNFVIAKNQQKRSAKSAQKKKLIFFVGVEGMVNPKLSLTVQFTAKSAQSIVNILLSAFRLHFKTGEQESHSVRQMWGSNPQLQEQR